MNMDQLNKKYQKRIFMERAIKSEIRRLERERDGIQIDGMTANYGLGGPEPTKAMRDKMAKAPYKDRTPEYYEKAIADLKAKLPQKLEHSDPKTWTKLFAGMKAQWNKIKQRALVKARRKQKHA